MKKLKPLLYVVLGLPVIVISGIYKEFGSPKLKTVFIGITIIMLVIVILQYTIGLF